MSELYSKQQALLRIIERSLDNFKKIGKSNYTPAKIRSRISSLKETWAECIQVHASLLQVTPEASRETTDYFKHKQFDAANDLVQSTLDFMADCLEELEPSVSLHHSTPVKTLNSSKPASAFSLAHLPSINLPQFSGKFEEWESFRDRFTSLIIDNEELSAVARLHFLSSSLAGQALGAIKSIPVTADNFEMAWQALKSRYENKRRLVDVHVATLMNLPTVSRESASELTNMRDQANRALASLKLLKRSPADILSDIIIFTMTAKLDAATRKAWKLRGGDHSDIPTYEAFDGFLAARARALEELSPPVMEKSSRSARCASTVASATFRLECVLCKASHFFSKCPQFMKKSPNQRVECVKSLNRCLNCLSAKHALTACPSKYTCRKCDKKHHTMLHVDTLSLTTTAADGKQSTLPPERMNVQSLSVLSSGQLAHSSVLLATARVRVSSESGRSHIVRALIDQGSEVTFITERLRQILRLRRIKRPLTISAVGGAEVETCRFAARILITPTVGTRQTLVAIASILRTLTSYIPSRDHMLPSWEHLDGLPLADPTPYNADPIDMLIGADLFGDIIQEGLRKGASGQPVAQNTLFGWVLSGPTSFPLQASTRINVQHCTAAGDLDKELRAFWEVEEIPRQISLSPSDQQCEDYFQRSHTRTEDGRYMVRLPFKHEPPIPLGESRQIAEQVLRRLQHRFRSQPQIRDEYAQFLREYEELGHMRQIVDHQALTAKAVYLPHHPVIRDSSSTTHLRVVFNASSPSSNATSLNDHLLTGAKLQTDLAAVILRWRTHRYVLTADIAKMYRQILVDPRDIDYQRILWAEDESRPTRVYQLLTVTYGMAAAPFLALRVLQQLLLDEGQHFPLAVPVLRDHIYVDDVLFGADDIPSLQQIRDQVRALLRLGHFNLRKWASNTAVLLSDIATVDHGLACNKNLQSEEQLKILGVSWNPTRDVFQFHVALPHSTSNTKRTVLSVISQIFDPLGWGTPTTVKAKVFIQRLWQLKLDWDERISSDLLTEWNAIQTSLADLDGLTIDRWVGYGSRCLRSELHGFADASSSAYAAVVYLRIVSVSGEITSTLLIGKSKVAPIKTWTIPRLELAAAVLLARSMTFVRKSLHMENVSCWCWTDSMVVLAWLSQHPSKWKTFVSNRVSEIQSSLPAAQWRHVPTYDNPADCASRGIFGRELATHPLWWTGPDWLRLDPSGWPSLSAPSTTCLEEKLRVTAHIDQESKSWELETRFSSWPKLLRVTAYIFRFISRLRKPPTREESRLIPSQALTAEEYQQAREFWIIRIQTENFPKEREALLSRRILSPKSPLISLSPFMGEDKIIYVGGRLKHATLPFRTKHPIVMAAHPVVSLIVADAHRRAAHAGPQLTLATLRHEFWILRARSLVRAHIHKCVACTRERAAVPSQLMGDLPEVRVNPPSRAFTNSGVDYAGPISVRSLSGRGITSRKAYIAIFVCLATRAVHLELVEGYGTPAFIAAFTRFCARRGLPASIYSDNGTTFVGADRELTRAFQSAIKDPNFQNKVASDRISWHFIPPAAPHFGGMWEAGVRSVKHHLRRIVGAHTLTFEEFCTLLCQIEACLNSRPLGSLTDSLDDCEPLTPGHFLIGAPLTAIPEPSLLQLKESRLSRWQLIRHMSERFWKLWSDDYINTLQQRVKWRGLSSDPVKVGRLVLIRNQVLPPCKWELGRVTKCHPGSDELVRVVSIKTATSEYVRPISKLCLLPIDAEDAAEELQR